LLTGSGWRKVAISTRGFRERGNSPSSTALAEAYSEMGIVYPFQMTPTTEEGAGCCPLTPWRVDVIARPCCLFRDIESREAEWKKTRLVLEDNNSAM
jgi:hypothetical protein